MIISTEVYNTDGAMYNLFPHPVKDERAYFVSVSTLGEGSMRKFSVFHYQDTVRKVPKKKLKDILW